jgi:hypothetical protein
MAREKMPKVIGSFEVKDWDQFINVFTDNSEARAG